MKTRALKIWMLSAVLLMLTGSFCSCAKEKFGSVWVCTSLHDNDVITLNIERRRVYVTTSYQDTSYYAGFYQFRNGDKFIIRKDAMVVNSNDQNDGWKRFDITKLSSDNMELEFLGVLLGDARNIGIYSFYRK